MGTRSYDVTLTGTTPLLMHWDNIEWAAQVDQYRKSPEGAKEKVAGDDRSPAWSWIGYAYHNDDVLVIPTDNIFKCIMEGATMVFVPGRGKKTFKSQSQSGMMASEASWPLLVDGKTIPIDRLRKLCDEKSFSAHKQAVIDLGFSLFVKRANIGKGKAKSKHVRVRPRFDRWQARGTILVWDDQITTESLTNIITYAGKYKGLCDWRPGGDTPGPYGIFSAEVREI